MKSTSWSRDERWLCSEVSRKNSGLTLRFLGGTFSVQTVVAGLEVVVLRVSGTVVYGSGMVRKLVVWAGEVASRSSILIVVG